MTHGIHVLDFKRFDSDYFHEFLGEWWQINIGSGNSLMLSGNRPLPEPMSTQIFAAVLHHYYATMS